MTDCLHICFVAEVGLLIIICLSKLFLKITLLFQESPAGIVMLQFKCIIEQTTVCFQIIGRETV